MSQVSQALECIICKDTVPLEESKTDEQGQAVHEECYFSMVISRPKCG